MSLVKLATACGLTAVCVSACGMAAKPVAGSANVTRAPGNHAKLDDPRVTHARCLRSHGLAFSEYLASGDRPAIQVGTRPTGPTIVFEPTTGDAQGVQITGGAQAAEVIGAALLYPNRASDGELNVVEHCVALGVSG